MGPVRVKNNWLVARYDDVGTVLTNSTLSKRFSAFNTDLPLQKSVIYQDPPDHARLRSVVQEFFVPKAIRQMEESVAQVVTDLICRTKRNQKMEFISEFANRLPITVIASLFGIPGEKHESLHKSSQDFVDGTNPNLPGRRAAFQQTKAVKALRQYFREAIDELQKCDPSGLLTKLVIAHREGSMTEEELVEMCVALIIGGADTTTNLMGTGLLSLLGHPSQLHEIRNNADLMKGAVEEMLRHESPVQQSTFRVTTKALTIGGVEIPEGQSVIAIIGSANRDPDKFSDPDRFDIHRKPLGHYAFGGGIHFCIGAALARIEATVALTSLITELPDLRLAKENLNWTAKLPDAGRWFGTSLLDGSDRTTVGWRHHPTIRGLRYLNLAW